MKFSVNWLREFVDLPDEIDSLSELLTLAGVEIEGIETRGAEIDNVIVAQITASSQHPNADRLTVCEVDHDSGTKRQIVCGATNYKVGDKVPLALPGAKLPNGLEIRKSKLRGVESEGMLCSSKELGLGDDAIGLLILSRDAKIGAPIVDLFPSDMILDVEITPNRGDLLSHFGLAREIAALMANKIKTSPPDDKIDIKSGVKISALHECPFFSARKIDNVTVGPSPDWLRAKIETIGIRAINNIVDISNFVLLELGQPTHAFDADKLQGDINVRLACDGEKFLALDGKTYSLGGDNLVIADDEHAIGIGGVMGGEETGVTESTKSVLLESAYFLPASIRRTARKLNLPSDASYRFERGVDPKMILRASHRATELIRELAGGTPAKHIGAAGKIPPSPRDVSLAYEKCNRDLGLTIKPKTVNQILERLGLIKNKSKPDKTRSTWKIPSYRHDLQRDVDLIEEIVRAHGVHKIIGTDRSRFTPSSAADHSHDLESALRARLVAYGLSETRTSKLIPRAAIALGERAIELRNPLSEDHVALRPSLIPGLLAVLERNRRAGAPSVRIFEMGRAFIPPDGKEERRLSILLCGNIASDPHWRSTNRSLDFFDLKGALETLEVKRISFRHAANEDFTLGADVFVGDDRIGFAAQLSSARAVELDATKPVFIAEVSLDAILSSESDDRPFHEVEKFPSITRDIAMVLPENLSHDAVIAAIKTGSEPLLERVELFDLFMVPVGGNLDARRKSLAYSLTYRDKNRTLTSEEVTVVHDRIKERLKRELGVELRE
jgi:phenylalanyl-tRNA synthetase beta chain